MWKLYCLAGDLDTDIVEADSNVGRVDESSIGSGDTVGGGLVDSGHGGDGVGGDLGDDSQVSDSPGMGSVQGNDRLSGVGIGQGTHNVPQQFLNNDFKVNLKA